MRKNMGLSHQNVGLFPKNIGLFRKNVAYSWRFKRKDVYLQR
jgi:hypothetical protein